MSAAILNDLPENFIRQMRNWARGKSGLIGGPSTCNSIYLRAGQNDVWGDSPIPILLNEVDDVDHALDETPARYRHVVMEYWLYEGLPISNHARKRGIDYRTFIVWVRQGHDFLRSNLARRRAAVTACSAANAAAAQNAVARDVL